MTYEIRWESKTTIGRKVVQYLPEIADVIRDAFGRDGAIEVTITHLKKESA